MNTLWLLILGGFLVITDYTVQKHSVTLDLKPDPRLEMEVIYYDKIDSIGMDGLHVFSQDSVVYVNKNNYGNIGRNKRW
jgi:hypothetical protein